MRIRDVSRCVSDQAYVLTRCRSRKNLLADQLSGPICEVYRRERVGSLCVSNLSSAEDLAADRIARQRQFFCLQGLASAGPGRRRLVTGLTTG